jgi:hypothetical protein
MGRQFQKGDEPQDGRSNMTSITVLRLCLSAAAAATIVACGGTDAPKTPLGVARPATSAADEAAVPPIRGEAKVALDSGNILFRAKLYDKALAQYRRSAELAPTELSPLLGIMMVADVTKDSKLAGATLPRIRKLNPMVADSSAAMSHAKMIEAHSRSAAAEGRR